MFARLLLLTKQIQLAAVAAVLTKRTVIRLTQEEWAELLDDPQFRRIHDDKTWTVINDVLVRCDQQPASSSSE